MKKKRKEKTKHLRTLIFHARKMAHISYPTFNAELYYIAKI